jgi:molybdopterin/thiamine biosynthesis adenylyltransferase
MDIMGSISYNDMFIRNQGLIEDQECLRTATVAIAGCGREGGSAAIALARMGVCKFRLADPDIVSVANLNSQFGARTSTLGRNKAIVIAEEIKDINPTAEVLVEMQGISRVNVNDFIRGTSIVVDAIDYHLPDLSMIFHRVARSNGITVLVAVSAAWNSYVFKFIPDGMTFERYIGLKDGCEPDEALKKPIPLLTFCPEPPSYVSAALVKKILKEKADIPAVAPAVNMTGAILAATIYFELSGKKILKPVPYYYATGDLFLSGPKKVPFWMKILIKLLG